VVVVSYLSGSDSRKLIRNANAVLIGRQCCGDNISHVIWLTPCTLLSVSGRSMCHIPGIRCALRDCAPTPGTRPSSRATYSKQESHLPIIEPQSPICLRSECLSNPLGYHRNCQDGSGITPSNPAISHGRRDSTPGLRTSSIANYRQDFRPLPCSVDFILRSRARDTPRVARDWRLAWRLRWRHARNNSRATLAPAEIHRGSKDR
jgi:hypothetical protein